MEIQTFQNSCQNASFSLIEKNLLKANDSARQRIELELQMLREESVKLEVFEDLTEIPLESNISSPDFFDHDHKVEDDVRDDSQVLVTALLTVPTSIKKPSKPDIIKIEHCPLCENSFAFPEHINEMHCIKTATYFCCKHCEGKYKTMFGFRRHFREFHMSSNKVNSCKFCPQIFYNKNLFYRHLRKVHSALASRYICDICQKDYRNITYLRSHMERHTTQIACPNCDAYFERSDFHKHRKSCGERYMCHICSVVVFTKKSLEQHIKRKHLPSPPCDICGKEFTCRMDLDHHKKILHSSKTQVCEQCGKAFFTENGLQSHVKFTHLKMQNEYAKKKFWCELCQRFESHTTKSAHEMKVKYGKRYKCDKCDKAFFSNQRLRRHYYVHTKMRPFNCKLCETGYYNTAYLKAHYERVHGSEYLGAIRK